MDRFRRYFIVIFHSARPVLVSDKRTLLLSTGITDRRSPRRSTPEPSNDLRATDSIHRVSTTNIVRLFVRYLYDCVCVRARVMYNDHLFCVGTRRYRFAGFGARRSSKRCVKVRSNGYDPKSTVEIDWKFRFFPVRFIVVTFRKRAASRTLFTSFVRTFYKSYYVYMYKI